MDTATAIKQRAQALVQRRSYREARAEYERLLKLEPVDPYAYILLGDLAARTGPPAEAAGRYTQAADAYEALGLCRNAIAVLKKVLRLDESRHDIQRRLADLYAREGLFAESVAHYLDFGSRCLATRRQDEARQVLEMVVQLGVPNPRMALKLADLLVAVGEKEQAALELLRVAEELEGRGQAERAKALRSRAAEVAPNAKLTEAWIQLGKKGTGAGTGGERASPADGRAEESGEEGPEESPEASPEEASAEEASPEEASPEGPGESAEQRPADLPLLAGLELAGGSLPPLASSEPVEPGPEAEQEPDPAPAVEPQPEPEARVRRREEIERLITAGEVTGAADRLAEAARESEDAGQFEEAAKVYLHLWQLRPREDVAERLEALAGAVGDAAGRARWRAEIGELALGMGDTEAATAHFERALEIDEAEPLARRRLDRLRNAAASSSAGLMNGDEPVDLAFESEFERLLRGGDREGASRLLLGAADRAESAGRSIEAEKLLVRLWELGHETGAVAARLEALGAARGDQAAQAQWRAEIGEQALSAGDWEAARGEFERALELDPHQPLARRRMERLRHVGDGKNDGPTPSNRLAWPAQPFDPAGQSETLAAAVEDLARVVGRFRQEVGAQLDAADQAGHYDLGMTYMEMGLHEEAIAEFTIALSGGGSYRQRCFELLGTCYSRSGQPLLAVEHWRGAIAEAADGDALEALHYELACALEAAGQVEEARAEFLEVLRRDPAHADARQRLTGLVA